MKVQVKLSRLLLTCSEDIITKADAIKLIPKFTTDENGTTTRIYKVEVTNPIDYTKEDFKKRFNCEKFITKWEHTIEDGTEKLVVVID